MQKLVVYSTPTCSTCRAAKRKLDALGIPYTPVDLTEDAEALERIKLALGTSTVQVPLFRWKSTYSTIVDLPAIIAEAKTIASFTD